MFQVRFPVIKCEAVWNLTMFKTKCILPISCSSNSVGRKGTVCHANIPIGRWHGNKWRVFHICIFQLSNLHSICPSGQQFVTSHNLSSGTEWLLLFDWLRKCSLFYFKDKMLWVGQGKQVGQMLYLPSSSFNSFNVSLKMAHLLKRWTLQLNFSYS